MSSGIVDSGFGFEDRVTWINFRGANVSDPGAVVRPCWIEDKIVFADTTGAVWFRVVAHASVAGCEEEGDALETELQVLVALPFLVRDRHIYFLPAVG